MDHSPFNELFALHFKQVQRYAERRLIDRGMAEDIAEETFAAAWEFIRRGGEPNLPGLYRVASNKLIDLIRKSERRREVAVALRRLVQEPPASLDVPSLRSGQS